MGVAWYAAPSFFGNIFLIALGFTILPLWLNLYALKGLSSSVMGMLLYINPLLSFLVASLVFHEPASQLQLVAYAVIFLSVLIFNAGIYLIKPKAT
jgi:chloramphenicol-sensitive protein RarD